MSYYLIGIGGTGARCLEAFVHINGAGLLKDAQDVRIVNVDADITCGNLERQQQAAKAYNIARSIDSAGIGQSGLFSNSVVTAATWCPVPNEEHDTNPNIDSLFSHTNLIQKSKNHSVGMLYEALFSQAEREVGLQKGFRAHPAIGASVMGSTVDTEKDEMWCTLVKTINDDANPKIFIFGSVFGGTGAAGLPTIATLLQNFLKKDINGNCVAKIGGCLLLPYFTFPVSNEEERHELQAKTNDFLLNTQSAIDYYDRKGYLGPVFKSLYMIGDQYLTLYPKHSKGAKDQKNPASIVEIYAALAAIDFFNLANYDIITTPMIARGNPNTENDEMIVTWEDLPDGDIKFRKSFQDYIKFLYLFNNWLFPALEKDRSISESKWNPFGAKRHVWEKELLEKNGNGININDESTWKKIVDFKEYCSLFLGWLKQICEQKPTNVKLVDHIFDGNVRVGDDKFDFENIIYRETPLEGKEPLNNITIENGLIAYADQHKTDGGLGQLLNGLYQVCKER